MSDRFLTRRRSWQYTTHWGVAYCSGLCLQHGSEHLATILLAWLGALCWGSVPWRREDATWCAQIQHYIEAAATL